MQTPAHTHAPIACGVRGQLLHDAIVRDRPAGDHRPTLIEVLLRQHLAHHPHALPVLARLPVPAQASDAATLAHAHALAGALRAGTEVLALGYGLETGNHHSQPVLRIVHCIAVHALEVDAPQAEPDLFTA